MTTRRSLAALALSALLLAAPWVRAADDHGHDHGAAAPTGQALPRFAAVSEAFELVGVLEGKHLTLYLDRAADNAPVTDAQIELEIAGVKFKAARHGTDEYEVTLAAEPKPGVLPITATVSVGKEVDLLAGELDLHEAAHPDTPAHAHSWRGYATWGAAALAALAAMVFIGRRLRGTRQLRSGGAA
jgi:hypothetical protein